MAFLSGKTGTATFAGTAYKIKSWSVRMTNQLQDVTNGNSSGYGEYIAGVTDIDWEIAGDYDTAAVPFASGKLNPGQTGVLVLLQSTGGHYWTIQAIVEESTNGLEVRGTVPFTAKGKGSWNGSVSYALTSA